MAIGTEPQFHVLAVDDSPFQRKIIEMLLKKSSLKVTTVDSGSKALEFLGLLQDQDQHEVEVSLIITDYCMPGMTGYELLMKIKESSSLKDIPVVIMSSENVPSRINRCLEGGAEEFLLKPVKLSDMDRVIPHILKAKRREHQEHRGPNNSDSSSSSSGNNSDSANSSSGSCSAKRKAATDDEDLSPERTRPRFSYGSG